MKAKRRRWAANPVLTRELKERMRGQRAWFVLMLYLLMLGGILVLVYQGRTGQSPNQFGQPLALESAAIGRSIFEWLVFFMLLLVLFLVPGVTSGAIAGERERQTLVPLQMTLLRPHSIVLGKVASSLAFLMLLVVATLPLLSISYLIGGVTMVQVVKALAAVLGTGVVLACLTVACSAAFKRVQGATVVAYGLALALCLGTFMLYGAAALIDRSRGVDRTDPPAELLLANPLVAAADMLDPSSGQTGNVDSPFDPLKELLLRDRERSIAIDVGPAIAVARAGGVAMAADVAQPADEGDGSSGGDGLAFWIESAGVLGLASLLALALATRQLRTPAKADR